MKYWLIVIASLLYLSAQGFPQSPIPPSPELLELLSRFSLPHVISDCPPPPLGAPLVIKKWIEENPECNRKPLWALLKTEGDTFDNVPNKECKIELQDIYLFAQKTTTKMLQITLADEAHYLFFSQPAANASPQSDWHLLGIVSSHSQQYGPPDLRFERGDEHDWVVINELGGRGTGVSLRSESWYEISRSGIKQVLSYPASGHDFTFPAVTNRSFKAMPIFIESDKSTVLVTFVVNYGTLLKIGIPLAISQKAFFVRDEMTGEFKLDETQSEITAEELDAVYNFDSLDDTAFLKYNRMALRKIVARAKPEQKNAWRKYLQETRPQGYSVLEELLK